MSYFYFFVLMLVIFSGPPSFICYVLYRRNKSLRRQLFELLNPDEEVNMFD